MKRLQQQQQQNVTHRSRSQTETLKIHAAQSKQKAPTVVAKQCTRHREGNSRRSLEIRLGVEGVTGEIVRATVAAAVEITDSDQEEAAVALTGTKISAVNK